jgi:tetratricopeptide (TPR) repeat protein
VIGRFDVAIARARHAVELDPLDALSQADAQASLAVLQKNYGETAAYQYGEILAQWGDIPRALSALERAVVLHDGGRTFTKVDPMLDPVRNEPRFKAVLAGLKFPD